jgi:hypothetical protein
MALSTFEEHLLLDARMRERLISEGHLDQKSVEKHLKDLKDVEGESMQLPVYEEPTAETDGDELTFSAGDTTTES